VVVTVGLTMFNMASGFLTFITGAIILLALVLGYALLISLFTNLLVRLALQIKDH